MWTEVKWTESEAWEAIADTLEMADSMPALFPRGPSTLLCSGLCSVVRIMSEDNLISPEIEGAMRTRIHVFLKGRKWLAPRGRIKPRIMLARLFSIASR